MCVYEFVRVDLISEIRSRHNQLINPVSESPRIIIKVGKKKKNFFFCFSFDWLWIENWLTLAIDLSRMVFVQLCRAVCERSMSKINLQSVNRKCHQIAKKFTANWWMIWWDTQTMAHRCDSYYTGWTHVIYLLIVIERTHIFTQRFQSLWVIFIKSIAGVTVQFIKEKERESEECFFLPFFQNERFILHGFDGGNTDCQPNIV